MVFTATMFGTSATCSVLLHPSDYPTPFSETLAYARLDPKPNAICVHVSAAIFLIPCVCDARISVTCFLVPLGGARLDRGKPAEHTKVSDATHVGQLLFLWSCQQQSHHSGVGSSVFNGGGDSSHFCVERTAHQIRFFREGGQHMSCAVLSVDAANVHADRAAVTTIAWSALYDDG